MKLGNDFDDTKPIAVTFALNQIKTIVEIPVRCDRRSETDERFDVSLTLTSNFPGVETGMDTATGIIRTTIGK